MKSLETYKFKGGINTFETEEWMHMMATKFEAMICPAKYKKRVAKEFRRKYFHPKARHRLERQFINFTQGKTSTEEDWLLAFE
ncbi:hypothetical protein DY000_02031767 [Brassica cretica]|uniref:Retrotransposon gag domain-containing protein n=1 Tax=Brassica cretica TaxID=69181 RepID=A0ABQ7DP24_BRACR|nr:hypothetical protein DY000_02031767 [Brassica cretica]